MYHIPTVDRWPTQNNNAIMILNVQGVFYWSAPKTGPLKKYPV